MGFNNEFSKMARPWDHFNRACLLIISYVINHFNFDRMLRLCFPFELSVVFFVPLGDPVLTAEISYFSLNLHSSSRNFEIIWIKATSLDWPISTSWTKMSKNRMNHAHLIKNQQQQKLDESLQLLVKSENNWTRIFQFQKSWVQHPSKALCRHSNIITRGHIPT